MADHFDRATLDEIGQSFSERHACQICGQRVCHVAVDDASDAKMVMITCLKCGYIRHFNAQSFFRFRLS